MQRWGKTKKGISRFFCPVCKITATRKRNDQKESLCRKRFVTWLTGSQNKSDIAKQYGVTRRALSKTFRPLFEKAEEPTIPSDLEVQTFIVDATYIHSNILCVLVAVTEKDKIFFRFAKEESYKTWHDFLSLLPKPKAVVADGQKGLKYALKQLWPQAAFQRCQFHVVSLCIQYLSRRPKEEAGRELLKLLYCLKDANTTKERDRWITLFSLWEHLYIKVLNSKTDTGKYVNAKLRGARLIVRRALPNLFTYLDYPNMPNTTNLVEGWVNAAVAEAIHRHRGLKLNQKKTLVSIILSHLTREKPTQKFP
jgi:antibiotic biosynthesis monooxygenase (ABM) superfamily enzyme